MRFACAASCERILRKAGLIPTFPAEKETPHMAGSKLDPIDRHILAELQADGSLQGEICLSSGDDIPFIAHRQTSSTAC